MDIRSGLIGWPAGQAGITVRVSPPVTRPYMVVAQVIDPTGSAAAASGEAAYFNVLGETRTDFQVQHTAGKEGVPTALGGSVMLEWVLFTN